MTSLGRKYPSVPNVISKTALVSEEAGNLLPGYKWAQGTRQSGHERGRDIFVAVRIGVQGNINSICVATLDGLNRKECSPVYVDGQLRRMLQINILGNSTISTISEYQLHAAWAQ